MDSVLDAEGEEGFIVGAETDEVELTVESVFTIGYFTTIIGAFG